MWVWLEADETCTVPPDRRDDGEITTARFRCAVVDGADAWRCTGTGAARIRVTGANAKGGLGSCLTDAVATSAAAAAHAVTLLADTLPVTAATNCEPVFPASRTHAANTNPFFTSIMAAGIAGKSEELGLARKSA